MNHPVSYTQRVSRCFRFLPGRAQPQKQRPRCKLVRDSVAITASTTYRNTSGSRQRCSGCQPVRSNLGCRNCLIGAMPAIAITRVCKPSALDQGVYARRFSLCSRTLTRAIRRIDQTGPSVASTTIIVFPFIAPYGKPRTAKVALNALCPVDHAPDRRSKSRCKPYTLAQRRRLVALPHQMAIVSP